MFARLATFTERRAVWVLAAWIAAAIALAVAAPSLQDVGTQDSADFLPADAPSQQADRLTRQLFPNDPTRDSALLVFERPGGLTPGDHAYIDRVGAEVAAGRPTTEVLAVQNTASAPDLAPILRSPDGGAELTILSFRAPPFTSRTNDAVAQIRRHIDSTAPAGLGHHLTGIAGLATDQADALLKSFDRTAIVTVFLVLLILIAVYRSVVAPLIPLVTIGVAFAVAQGVVALLAEAGFKVSSMAGTFMVVMIFGAGTDYCLFIVSRHREELGRGDEVPATVRRTMTVMGAVIAASAATVIVGFLSQLSADFGVYRTMGPAMGVAIFITLLAGLTLTPALLRLTGKGAFWPQQFHHLQDQHGQHGAASERWERLAAVIRRRPAEVLLAGVIALLIPAAGLGWFRQSFDLVNDLPGSADARQGFEALARHYPGGMLSPVNVVVQSDGPIIDDAKLAAVDRLTDALRAQPGVAEVRSVTQPAGAPLTVGTLAALSGGSDALGIDPNQVDVTPLYNAMAAPGGLRLNATLLAAYPQLAAKLGVFQGADGNSTRLIVALEGNPYEQGALDAFREIDDTAAHSLAGSVLAGSRLAVGGPTSFYSDMQAIGNSDFRTIAVVLLASIFVVLALLLRSLVAPLFLLATVVLSYAATMGITAVFFQGVLGDPGISFWLPAFLFIILVALGADYNIFIMSRIREEAEAGREIHEAASRGLVLTGRVITSAGLILAGTFAALVVAPLPNLRHIGFGVTVGVLLDTFLVRSLLVPSATVLLGRWAFWPSFPGTPAVARSRTPRPQVAAIGVALCAFAVGLGLVAATGGIDRPITVVAAPTAASPAPVTAAVTAAQPEATGTTQAAAPPPLPTPTTSADHPGRGVGVPDTAPPQAIAALSAPTRIAVPAAGGWRFHVEGTRRIGAAGSTQPFAEDVTTQVTRTGGTDEAPEVRLRTESGSGTEEYLRRYRPEALELLSTSLSSGVTSFGGTFQPPQVLARWPLQVGDTWSGDWSTESTTGHTDTRVVGVRDVNLAGRDWRCFDIRSDSAFRGSAEGEQHQTACWVPELGMSVDDRQEYRGTYNGISFDITTRTTLLATP